MKRNVGKRALKLKGQINIYKCSMYVYIKKASKLSVAKIIKAHLSLILHWQFGNFRGFLPLPPAYSCHDSDFFLQVWYILYIHSKKYLSRLAGFVPPLLPGGGVRGEHARPPPRPGHAHVSELALLQQTKWNWQGVSSLVPQLSRYNKIQIF